LIAKFWLFFGGTMDKTLIRYLKLTYSIFDYYDYKGNFSFPSLHFIRNTEKVIGKSSKSSRTDSP
jgi:hypothetical protein